MNNYKILRGNTYPIQHLIRGAGGIWNPDKKGWMVPREVYNELKSQIPKKIYNKPSLIIKW